MLGLEDHTAYDKTTRWGLEKGPKLQKKTKNCSPSGVVFYEMYLCIAGDTAG